jgi:hypothetical protein
MDKKIFSETAESFLRDNMCICIDHLSNKIFEETPQEIDFFNKLINYYISITFPHNSEHDLSYREQSENRDIFESKLNTFESDNTLEEDSKTSKIYDELYHALRSYTTEGLLGLYKHKDATFWYPKILITQNIGSRNDINNLDEEVIIYRGTNIDEFNSKVFSQAWTLDKKIAQQFAFVHYVGQPNYINTSRVIIKAKINKNDIYFYDKSLMEQEVVINPSEIVTTSAEVIEQKTLK